MTIDEFLKKFREMARKADEHGYVLGVKGKRKLIRFFEKNTGFTFSMSCPVCAVDLGYKGGLSYNNSARALGLSMKDAKSIADAADNKCGKDQFLRRLRHRLLDAKRTNWHKPKIVHKSIDVVA